MQLRAAVSHLWPLINYWSVSITWPVSLTVNQRNSRNVLRRLSNNNSSDQTLSRLLISWSDDLLMSCWDCDSDLLHVQQKQFSLKVPELSPTSPGLFRSWRDVSSSHGGMRKKTRICAESSGTNRGNRITEATWCVQRRKQCQISELVMISVSNWTVTVQTGLSQSSPV